MSNIARSAWLQEGLPIETGATTVDSRCGSGQQAVNVVSARIAAGIHDVGIGCGVEHMGRNGFAVVGRACAGRSASRSRRKLLAVHQLQEQGLSAEQIADEWEIPRTELDALALRSHQLAAAATDAGGSRARSSRSRPTGRSVDDQGIRRSTTLESLAALKPVFKPDGKLTAGTSSQISDGAGGAPADDR